MREEELFRGYEYLGVPPDRVTVLDDLYVVYSSLDMSDLTSRRLQDGMNNHWASSHVSQVLDKHLQTNPASIVSSHPYRIN